MVTLSEIQRKYPKVMWDLKGVSGKIQDIILPVFDDIVTKYPVILTRLEYIGTGRMMYGKDIAVSHDWHPDTTGDNNTCICLNPEYYGDYAKFTQELDKDAAIHFHPVGTGNIASSFTHELGHILLFAMLDQACGPVVKEWMQTHAATPELSTYAMVNSDEAWAEGFAAIERGTPPVLYTISQSRLLDWTRKTNCLSQTKEGYSTEDNMGKTLEETKKESDEKEKEAQSTEKNMGDTAAIIDQIQMLLNQLKQASSYDSGAPSAKWCQV